MLKANQVGYIQHMITTHAVLLPMGAGIKEIESINTWENVCQKMAPTEGDLIIARSADLKKIYHAMVHKVKGTAITVKVYAEFNTDGSDVKPKKKPKKKSKDDAKQDENLDDSSANQDESLTGSDAKQDDTENQDDNVSDINLEDNQSAEYFAKWRGPNAKWCVMKRSSGESLEDGYAEKELAETAADKLNAAE